MCVYNVAGVWTCSAVYWYYTISKAKGPLEYPACSNAVQSYPLGHCNATRLLSSLLRVISAPAIRELVGLRNTDATTSLAAAAVQRVW